MKQPCGTYSRSYRDETAEIHTRLQWGLLIFFFAIIFAFPLLVNVNFLKLAETLFISVVAVLGLNIVMGLCGQVSMGQAAFVGIGAYTTAILAMRGVPSIGALLGAIIVAAIFGFIFGLPALRVKGFYLAVATIALQFVFGFMVVHLPHDFAGTVWGIHITPAKIGAFAFDTPIRRYYLLACTTLICGFLAKNLVRSRVGRAFMATRDNDLAAEAMGVNLTAYKLLAFVLAAAFGAVSGWMTAYTQLFVHYEQFTLWLSVWYVGMLIVGGIGTLLGTVFGVILLRGIEWAVITYSSAIASVVPMGPGQIYPIINMLFAALVIACVLLEPRGLVNRWNIFKMSYRVWPFSY